jgi:hypothetical protein
MKNFEVMLEKHRQNIRFMEKQNQIYSGMEIDVELYDNDCREIASYISALKNLLILVQEQKSAYVNAMTRTMEEAIQSSMDIIIPEKHYSVILEPSVYRNKNIYKIYLVDQFGRRLPPKIVEGDMLNQVLSFTAIAALVYKMGLGWMYYDEAFNSANVRSLIRIKDLLQSYLNIGLNFVLVTQDPLLMDGIERHVISIEVAGGAPASIEEFNVKESDSSENDKKAVDSYDEYLKR